MGTDRSTSPSADPSTVWLADLIEATEAVAASAEPCDPAIVKAFRHRLELRADVRPLFEPAAMDTGGFRQRSGVLQYREAASCVVGPPR